MTRNELIKEWFTQFRADKNIEANQYVTEQMILEWLAEKEVNKISCNPVLADSKIYHRGRVIHYEEAKDVMDEFPEEDNYVQAHYEQFLTDGEADDNTIDTSNYWNKCKKVVERGR